MSRFGCRVDAEAPWPMPQSDTVIPGQLALPSTASTEPEPAAPPAAPAPADAKPKSVDEALIKALDAQAPCGSHVDPMWIPCGSHVDPSAVCGIRCFGVRKFEL